MFSLYFNHWEIARSLATAVLYTESKQGTRTRAKDASRECSDQPAPAVQASRGDPAEVRADIASVGEAGAVSQQQAADDRGEQRTRIDAPLWMKFAGEPRGQ